MTNKWNYQPPTQTEIQERDHLAAELGLSPVISLLLVRRGLKTAKEVKKFFRPAILRIEEMLKKYNAE